MIVTLPGRQFKSPGPVASAFLADRTSKVRALLGPQGGGKTVTCMHDMPSAAALMPLCRDGVIRARFAAIRDTYDRLEKTTIKSWTEWFPKGIGEFSGGGGRSASHRLNFKTMRAGREVPIEFEIIFAAIGDQSAEDFMRGFEVTGFWLNEMDLLAEDVLTYGVGRVGRYPRIQDIDPRTPLARFPGYTLGNLPPGVSYDQLRPDDVFRSYIIGDLNAPDVDSWFYRRFEEEKLEGFKLYRQPSGRSARAENKHNLVPGYYETQAQLNASKPKWIKRFIDAEYGPSDNGEPVYPEYSDDVHLAREPIRPAKNIPLIIGLDAGLQRPAGVICQMKPSGQWVVLGEVVPGRCGSARFCEALKRELAELAELAGVQRLEIEAIYSDPFGFTGADREAGETAWSERVMLEMQHPVMPTETNEIEPRLSAVRDELTYMIDGNTPALMISPRCRILRKGFASDYAYARQRVGNTERTADKPDKTSVTADPHDALQYAMLGKKGRFGVIGNTRAGRKDRATAPALPSGGGQAKDTGWQW
ncbi:MAG: hypothetical protein ACRCS9_08815 [Hyphomicrobium sp.]